MLLVRNNAAFTAQSFTLSIGTKRKNLSEKLNFLTILPKKEVFFLQK
jgi:hypothetical protein